MRRDGEPGTANFFMAYVLAVEISAGTKERLLRKYREATNDYSAKGLEGDNFDAWFNKWLNGVLAAKPEREKEVTEMDDDQNYKK